MNAGKTRPDFNEEVQKMFDRLVEIIDQELLADRDGFELYPGRMITDPHNYAKTLRDSLQGQNAAARRAGDVEERLRIFLGKVDT